MAYTIANIRTMLRRLQHFFLSLILAVLPFVANAGAGHQLSGHALPSAVEHCDHAEAGQEGRHQTGQLCVSMCMLSVAAPLFIAVLAAIAPAEQFGSHRLWAKLESPSFPIEKPPKQIS